MYPLIIPTQCEMEIDVFTEFVPEKLTKDNKIEMSLKDVMAIKRDNIVVALNFDVGGSFPNIDRSFRGEGKR